MNNIRSFANSYLYTRIPDYEKNIFEFVMKAERINKNSEAFSGIVEDVKRRQTTAVLSRVLARDDVILCINSKPLPASFKVFACKDVKNDRSVKVFIDLTGLISVKNGYFVINKIDVFCSYLMSAMTTIVYTKEPTKLTANSTLIQSGTSCFIALASHIFDYLRMPGYSENQNKISYILAMYYQCTLLGLNRNDNSVKNLAAKLSGVDTRSIAAVEFLYDDKDLVNIDTLINGIAKTFRLNGLGTDTFIEKWTWIYGVGTLFGTELFTSFASMITDAYCGAYVNNQKTIEKCCGRDMVNFSTALIRACESALDRGFRYESALDREIDKKTKTVAQESYSNSITKKNSKLYKGDIQNIDTVKAKYMANLSATNSLREASKLAESYMNVALDEFDDICKSESKYSSFVGAVAETVSPNMTSKALESVSNKLIERINGLNKAIHENEENTKGVLDDELDDLKQALDTIDPDNIVTKASEKAAELNEAFSIGKKKKAAKEIEEKYKAVLPKVNAAAKKVLDKYSKDPKIEKKCISLFKAYIKKAEDESYNIGIDANEKRELQYYIDHPQKDIFVTGSSIGHYDSTLQCIVLDVLNLNHTPGDALNSMTYSIARDIAKELGDIGTPYTITGSNLKEDDCNTCYFKFKEVKNESALDEGTVGDTVKAAVKEKIDLKQVKAQWKEQTKGFVKGKWVTRYINEADKNKLMKYYKEMCNEDLSYSDYKRYFKAICNFMRIPAEDVVIESLEIRKDNTDKDQDVIAMRYSKGKSKVKIPDGVRLIHVSPVDNIESLIPSFRSRQTGKFLYPNKRVYFTVSKEIKSTKAGLEKTKTYRYTPKDKIEYANIDPACADESSRAVYVESNKPIPVVKFDRLMDKLFGGGSKESNSKEETDEGSK